MDLVGRVKGIMLRPGETWEKIKTEETSIKDLYVSYAAILALIPAAASWMGLSLIGTSVMGVHYRFSIGSGLTNAILQYVFSLIAVYVVAFIVDALAPNFGSRKDIVAAFKLTVYSFTPAWIAGILGIFPSLNILIVLASLYGFYLLYAGLPVLMETPKEKQIGYFVVTIVVAIIVWSLIGSLTGLIVGRPMMR